jgi:alpha/beta superfamily hydrolase
MAESYITGASDEPPLLLFVGENDLPSQLQSMVAPVEHIRRVGLVHQIVRIAGANHFYPRTVDVISENGERTALESLMALFLHRNLRLDALR